MFVYAQLDEMNRVVGISELAGRVDLEYMINITELGEKPEIGSIYDKLTGIFTPPELLEEPIIQPTVEEQILAETQYQTALLEVNALGGNV